MGSMHYTNLSRGFQPFGHEDAYYMDEIGKMNQLRPGEVLINDVIKLYDLLSSNKPSNDPHNIYLINKYFGLNKTFDYFLQKKERFLQLVEAYLNLAPHSFTYGTFLPSYQKKLTLWNKTYPKPGHNALLLAHRAGPSQREFVKTIRGIFENNSTIMIHEGDMLEENSVKYADEVHVQNPLDIPYENNSFHSVHSTMILEKIDTLLAPPHLQGKGDNNRILLYQEIKRILVPDGMVMMTEKLTFKSTPEMITHEMKLSGFQNIRIEEVEYAKHRRLVDRFMRGVIHELPREGILRRSDIMLITAQK